MAKFPESYSDPLYDELDAANEQKLGLPVGLLSSIRTKGEKSNNSQVSSAGAASPYQIIPATRDAAIEKYGIDPTLSPQNASEVAGLLLKDSLKRNNNDPAQAVGEYVAGVDRKNWGKVTQAYINRVMTGQQSKKSDALSDGFAKFMADNPATSSTPTAGPAAEAKQDPLAAGFGQWLKMGAPKTLADTIPRDDGTYAPSQVTPQADPSLVENIVGGGETALALASGATTGALGMIGGTAKGLVNSVRDGTFGTQQGVNAIEQAAGQGAEAGTYAPRTAAGQDMTNAAGTALAAAIPLSALTAEAGAAGQAVSTAAAGARDLAGPAVSAGVAAARRASPAIVDRVQRVLARNPEPEAVPQTGGGSVGAAGADTVNQRREFGENLPVPIDLTEAQATREQMQTMFERETAKMEGGSKIRDRYAEQNEQVPQNFDAWVDQTGAQAYGPRAVGKSVVDAIEQKAARDKVQVKVAYKEAEKSPESRAAVDPGEVVALGGDDNPLNTSLIDYLNSKPTGLKTTALTDHAKQYAVRLGIADKAEDGTLIPKTTDVSTMESLRKEINQATGFEPSEVRDSTILKGIIDAQTEPVAGPLYRNARRLRENFSKQYEDREMVDRLLDTKGQYADRKVALEDVFQNTILKGTLDDRRHLRRVLLAHDAESPPEIKAAGQQAWNDLQGALVQHLKDDSLKNVATDTRGNPIFSAAKLNDNVRKLDQDGTLDFVLGKKAASDVRDMNELVKLVYTAPPGSFNTSGTTATLLSALGEAGVSTALTGLPIPVITTLKFLAKRSKDIKLQKRIDAALARRPRATPPPTNQF